LLKISIIIPAYNAEQWIADALASCLQQKFDSFEVIVIDDGSTDNTYSVISRYVEINERIMRVIRTTNKGASAARNVGLSAATGKYILFLDADDMLTEGALEVLGSIAVDTNADAVFAAHCDLDHASGRETTVQQKLIYQDSYANIARLFWPTGAALFRNTELRWNETRVVWEVMEYLFEFLAAGRQVAYTDFMVVKIRHHDSVGRITNRFDHYEPAKTGRFFAEQKEKLINCGCLNFERASALDFHILTNAYQLLRGGRSQEADRLYDTVSWHHLLKYDWCRFGSMAWIAGWGGRKLGTRSFYYMNKILGRT
jgi:glycosyltransferase involved in cell wall biosynthesis